MEDERRTFNELIFMESEMKIGMRVAGVAWLNTIFWHNLRNPTL